MLFYMLDLQNFFLISDTEFISVRTQQNFQSQVLSDVHDRVQARLSLGPEIFIWSHACLHGLK